VFINIPKLYYKLTENYQIVSFLRCNFRLLFHKHCKNYLVVVLSIITDTLYRVIM